MATDFSNIYGGSILSFVEETIGSIQNINHPYSINSSRSYPKNYDYDFKTNVRVYDAEIRDEPNYKVMFTVGLFAHHMKECFICLPASWHLPHYVFNKDFLDGNLTNAPYLPETLPLNILSEIAKQATRKSAKFKIDEGVFLDKTKNTWSNFYWQENLLGMTMIDYRWGETEDDFDDYADENTVKLFTLVPVSEDKKNLTEQWYNDKRYGKWEQFALPIFSDIDLFPEMNQAMLDSDFGKARDLVKAGVNINRGIYQPTPPRWDGECDDYVDETFLEHLVRPVGKRPYSKDEIEMAMSLIENGAKIPTDILAKIAGGADIDLFDKFISFDCDINAVDRVGYTALNRAFGLENWPLVEHIISLGGCYRVQEYDEELYQDKMQQLRNMGAKFDYSGIKRS